MSSGIDPRLVQAFHLLESVLEETSGAGAAPPSHWSLPVPPTSGPDGRMSATDVMTWWFRTPLDRPAPWDDYFGAASSGSTAFGRPQGLREGPPESPSASPPAAGWGGAAETLSALQALAPDQEEALLEEHAEGAVECLYEFLHAFGRRDVEAAMAQVDPSYHVLEDDREIGHQQLRQHIESVLDRFRGWEIDASLAVAPEPMPHPYGVLIFAQIQVDARHPDTGSRESIVEERIALLKQVADGSWKIFALSLTDT